MSTEPTKRPARTPTDAEMPALLTALDAAGGNIAAFARERGLSPWKLYEARRAADGERLRRRERRRDADRVFARVQVLEEQTSQREPLEVVVGTGYRVRVPAGFDESTLRRLMGVLTSC